MFVPKYTITNKLLANIKNTMKNKVLLFILLLVSVFFFSACSSKKNESKNMQEVRNEPIQTNEASNSSGQLIAENFNQMSRECSVQNLLFRYPVDWGECKDIENGVSFRTNDDQYQVELVLNLREVTNEEYSRNKEYSFNNNKLDSGRGEFFEEAQGGDLMSGFISLGSYYYKFTFSIISEQIAPEKLDGIWTPSHNVSKDNLISILRSAELN